jgi:hypothetical protein
MHGGLIPAALQGLQCGLVMMCHFFKMKTIGQSLLLVLLSIGFQFSTVFAQGTAFTYQGQLRTYGSPASGTYDLTFTLFSTNFGGVVIAGPVTNSAVKVTNGLFTVLIDFGPGVFSGAANWLEISVKTNGATTFTTLAPRQQLTPVPSALYAEGANATGLCGTLCAERLPSSVVTNGSGGVSLVGSFSGNGGGLTNVWAAAVTVATNTVDGVRVVYNNSGSGLATNYFGNANTAFTNAVCFATNYSGSTVFVGPGIYLGDPNIPAITSPVNIIGSGPGTWDGGLRRFSGGTIITNGGVQFLGGVAAGGQAFSNSVLANISFEGGNQFLLMYFATNTYPFNCLIYNVSLGGTADYVDEENIYFSGANLTIKNFAAYDLRMGHGFIIKGCDNFIADSVLLKNVGGNGGQCIFFEPNKQSNGNGNNTHCRLSNFVIDSGTNRVSSHIGIIANTGSTNDDTDIHSFIIQGSASNNCPAINLQVQATDAQISNTRFSNISASGSIYTLFQIYSPGGIGVITNNFASDCQLKHHAQAWVGALQTLTFPANAIIYDNIVVNGQVFSGQSTSNLNSSGWYNSSTTNRFNVTGGMSVDSISGNGSGLTNTAAIRVLTNAAPPKVVPGSGYFWPSNYDLYWVTPTRTNLIISGH